MKKTVQLAVGTIAIFWLAPHTFGTPIHHWMVFVPLFIGSMYGVAVVQHYWAHRANR